MELTDRFNDALTCAFGWHRTQGKKGKGVPYIAHLLSAAGLVLEHGGDEDQAIATLLHDAVEDTGATYGDIEERFGKRVADIVRACSDTEEKPKPPWLKRKQSYLEHLESAPADALLVSLADKVDNVRSIAVDVERDGETYFVVFNGGADGSRWYYRRLADVYQRRASELPSESVDGHSRPGGDGLLAEYLLALDRIGATPDAADAFEAKPAD